MEGVEVEGGAEGSGDDEEQLSPGDFRNFPQISYKTVEKLNAMGVEELFPVQFSTFN